MDAEPSLQTKRAQRIKRLKREARRIRAWLAQNPEHRKGSRGALRKSNRTDNDSAKMAGGKGVIQSYRQTGPGGLPSALRLRARLDRTG